MTEASFRRAVLRLIRRRHPTAWVLGGRHSTAGIPDLCCCINSRWVALELKTTRGRVTPIQAATLEKIRRAGGEAYVVRSVVDLDSILSR